MSNPFKRAISAVLSAVSTAVVLACACGPRPAPSGLPLFPVGISENRRYLTDRKGRPFFYHADTGWQALWKLSPEDAERYLDDRAKKGFTAVQVQLLPHRFLQTNAEKDNPFTLPGDLTKSNPEYLDHAERFLKKAQEKGLLVSLAPVWISRWEQDWHKVLIDSNAQVYGDAIGKRFKKCRNVLWILGGDADPENLVEEERILARALKKAAKFQLLTYHAGVKPSTAFFGSDGWLDVDMAYDYGWIASQVSSCYWRTNPVRPVILGESHYDDNGNGRGPYDIRRQAYTALLSGACGHAYGHGSVWDFDGRWREALDASSAVQMGHLKALFSSVAWHLLVPDTAHRVLTAGFGQDSTAAAAAVTPDGSLALAYVPTPRKVTLALEAFSGTVSIQWFDPSSGRTSGGGRFESKGKAELAPPGRNADGKGDWVMVVKTE
jgi:hypothetical protein